MKKKSDEDFFYSFDSSMAHTEFRYKISELGLNIDANGDKLIRSLILSDDQNSINLELFLKILTHFKNNTKKVSFDFL